MASDVVANERNCWASETRSVILNVESMVTPCTTDPIKALSVNGLYCFSAWVISAFKNAF